MDDLPGFSASNDHHCDDINHVKFTKRTKNKSGGFQAMGLSYPVVKGITKRGYKVPTPIQRKTIPLILEGRDVVAMAKTGKNSFAAQILDFCH